MEKYKKARELGKTLQIEEKLANIPIRGLVASPLCKQKTEKILSKFPVRRKPCV